MNIYCANCEHECSAAARACPACGHPLVVSPIARPIPQPPVVVRPVQTVQTIEKTSKGWKAMFLLAGLLLLIGIGACLIRPGYGGEFLILTGVLLYTGSKLCAWWEHG